MGEPLRPGPYRDMQLLQEVAQTPRATQRDLSKRIGVALGLTNLMLRRLISKGSIEIISTKNGKIGYRITPQGIHEKERLTNQFIQDSLDLSVQARRLLREQMTGIARSGKRRIVLCGTDELAAVVCLTLQEMGLELLGVIDTSTERERFLGYPIQKISEVSCSEVDRFIVSLRDQDEILERLQAAGVPRERIVALSLPGVQEILPRMQELPTFLMEAPDPERFPSGKSNLGPSETDVVVLCGGKGTRLGSLTSKVPKPLLLVKERPFLFHLLRQLEQEGFKHFILAAHYLADRFQEFLMLYGHLLPSVELVVEPEPLGTGGALRHAVGHVGSSTLLVLNGDSLVSQPIAPVLAEHEQAGRDFTVVAVQASHVEGGAFNKGVWQIGSQGEVVGFDTEKAVEDGWVNAGVYLLSRATVASWPAGHYSLEENLPSLLRDRQADVFCSPGRLLDIGTPQTYEFADRLVEVS